MNIMKCIKDEMRERERERKKKNECYIRNNILNITLYTYDISI